MPKWEEIRTSVGRVASQTVKATEEVASSASMHVKLSRLMSKRDEQFEKLGRLTYKQLKADQSYAEEIAAIIAHIDSLNLQISRQKAKIEEAKLQKANEKEQKKQEKAAAKAAKAEDEDAATKACADQLRDIIDENISD